MWRVVANAAWSVSMCVCLLDITVSCAKTAETIEMPFWVWTRMGSRNHVLDGVWITLWYGVLLVSFRGTYYGMPRRVVSRHTQLYSQDGSMCLIAVDKHNVIHKVAAAMRPRATSTVAACYC